MPNDLGLWVERGQTKGSRCTRGGDGFSKLLTDCRGQVRMGGTHVTESGFRSHDPTAIHKQSTGTAGTKHKHNC